MMDIPLIEVNEHGEDAKGNSYGDIATEDAVLDGFVINRPVRLKFPNGSIVVTNEVRITAKGMEKAAEMHKLDLH